VRVIVVVVVDYVEILFRETYICTLWEKKSLLRNILNEYFTDIILSSLKYAHDVYKALVKYLYKCYSHYTLFWD